MPMTKWTGFIALLVVCLTLVGCAGSPAPAPAPTTPAATAGATGEPTGLASYKLGSGDRLRVTIFNEPELSGEYIVDGTGIVSMPLIGEMSVAGMTVREFQRLAESQFGAGILNNPKVAAEVINYRPYYILGEVGDPGEYPFQSGLTVMNAVATAGGFSYRANRKTVFIRSAEGEERPIQLNASTPVKPGDTIRIGERLF